MLYKIFFLAFFVLNCYSQNIVDFSFDNLPIPDKTELIKTERIKNPTPIDILDFRFVTELNFKEIAEFYRSLFSDLGFRESRNLSTKNYLHFVKGFIQKAEIIFFDSNLYSNEKKNSYILRIYNISDLLGISEFNLEKPTKFKNLPIYPNALEVVEEYYGQKILNPYYRDYLVNANFKDVVNFYKQNMQKLGWKLKLENTVEGKFNFFDIFAVDDGQVSEKESFKNEFGFDPSILYPEIELNVKRSVLQYELNDTVCIFLIIEFKDSSEELSRLRINPEIFNRYGRVYIQVISYTKSDEKNFLQEEKVTPEDVELLRDYLGL